MNKNEESIGFGTVKDDWVAKHGIVKLEYDLGDFLRRERNVMQKPGKSRHRRS